MTPSTKWPFESLVPTNSAWACHVFLLPGACRWSSVAATVHQTSAPGTFLPPRDDLYLLKKRNRLPGITTNVEHVHATHIHTHNTTHEHTHEHIHTSVQYPFSFQVSKCLEQYVRLFFLCPESALNTQNTTGKVIVLC